jgi:hypothetical protein
VRNATKFSIWLFFLRKKGSRITNHDDKWSFSETTSFFQKLDKKLREKFVLLVVVREVIYEDEVVVLRVDSFVFEEIGETDDARVSTRYSQHQLKRVHSFSSPFHGSHLTSNRIILLE